MKYIILISFLFLCFSRVLAQELVSYPVPNSVLYSQHNDDYTVKVRKPGGEWVDLFEYNVKVDLDKVRDASMVAFDFSGKVEVYVRKNNGALNTAVVRPLSYGIKAQIQGNSILFSLDRPRKLSIEFNGDKLQNLHLFANPMETNKPNEKDPNVVYFGPGIHTPPDVPGDAFRITSGKTVYLAAGAILRGRLVVDHAENVKICGRGFIDQAVRGIEVTHSKNVEIDGITVINPKHYTVYGGQSQQLSIRNLKSFSCNGWSDGLDLMSCSDVKIEDVFLRTSDDCIAIYGHRWDFWGGVKNVSVSNSVLWADIAHPTTIGLHGDTNAQGDTVQNIRFSNIDILEHDEDDPEYQGCMAICAGDFNLVRNVRYEDIRVEDFEEGQLFHLVISFNKKYNTGAGRGIEDVHFKNISYSGNAANLSVISGLDKTHLIRAVTFENVKINGVLLKDAHSGQLKIGEFVEGLKFLP